MTTNATKTIDVEAPIEQVYNLWTDFANFPNFMANVEQVDVLDSNRLHWKASILGVEREWNAEVTDQIPGEKVAWRSTDGVDNSGVVTFEPIDVNTTRVNVDLNFTPDGLIEKVGDILGLAGDGAEGDLRRFKEYAENTAPQTQNSALADQSSTPLGASAPAAASTVAPAGTTFENSDPSDLRADETRRDDIINSSDPLNADIEEPAAYPDAAYPPGTTARPAI